MAKKLVYVCSPYAGDVDKNVENACKFSRYVYEQGCIPITPHLLYPQFLDDANDNERADGLNIGIELLNLCNEIWVFGEKISAGMTAEIAMAEYKNMPIKYIKEI